MVKNGGNVVSYFCTPEGQLLHAVGGPVSGEKLLAEARWARDLALDMQNKSRQSKAEFVRKAHENASRRGQTHYLARLKPIFSGPCASIAIAVRIHAHVKGRDETVSFTQWGKIRIESFRDMQCLRGICSGGKKESADTPGSTIKRSNDPLKKSLAATISKRFCFE